MGYVEENLAFPRHLHIQVYENQDAVTPLVEAFGTGPWDERFGVRHGHFRRVFAGSSLAALEADERVSGVESPDPLGLRRPCKNCGPQLRVIPLIN